MKGKLIKLEILKNKNSAIVANRYEEGTLAIRYRNKDTEYPKKLDEIKEGNYVVVYKNIYEFVKTSAIVKILERSDTYIKFETETSIYQFSRVGKK